MSLLEEVTAELTLKNRELMRQQGWHTEGSLLGRRDIRGERQGGEPLQGHTVLCC